jgi:hypothetical protein
VTREAKIRVKEKNKKKHSEVKRKNENIKSKNEKKRKGQQITRSAVNSTRPTETDNKNIVEKDAKEQEGGNNSCGQQRWIQH